MILIFINFVLLPIENSSVINSSGVRRYLFHFLFDCERAFHQLCHSLGFIGGSREHFGGELRCPAAAIIDPDLDEIRFAWREFAHRARPGPM